MNNIKLISPSRISWIDIAKGYGIILVIYAHLGTGPLWTWIYSFHMPLFFFLSGYVFSTKYAFREFLFKKIKSIVIPYFCLGIPMVLVKIAYTILFNEILSLRDCLHYMIQLLLQQRFWTLWFIACLFFLNILFYILIKLCSSEVFILFISFILPCVGLIYYKLGGSALYWNIDVCFMAIPFFALGYLYKLHAKQIDDFIMSKSKIFFILFSVINIIFWRLSLDESGLGLEMFVSHYGKPFFTYLAAFSGIFCVIIISKCFCIKPIQYLGENSMIYYAWHQTIMIPIFTKFFSLIGLHSLSTLGVIGTETYKLICLISILFALTFCNYCIEKLGMKFIVGK